MVIFDVDMSAATVDTLAADWIFEHLHASLYITNASVASATLSVSAL